MAGVVAVTRPEHLFKLLRQPAGIIKAFKYHYRRVPERAFVDFLGHGKGRSAADIASAYHDFAGNQPVWDQLRKILSEYPDGYGLQMTRELPALYLLVRLVKPIRIVETGVSSGASSAYILRALHDNSKGTLYSIDLPSTDLPEGKDPGWIVPHDLRSRWTLKIGDAKELLAPMLDELGETDIFIHDSLHTYDHMLWEFRTVWPYLRTGGIFFVHDVGRNQAFFDFMKEKNIPWKSYRVFHVLGGFCKR